MAAFLAYQGWRGSSLVHPNSVQANIGNSQPVFSQGFNVMLNMLRIMVS